MFDRSKVSRYIQDYMEWNLPEAVRRDLEIPDTDKVVTIFGPRRCGKTFFLFQMIGEAIDAGVEKENLLYLNLEDTRLSDLDFRDLEEVLALHYELHPGALEGNIRVFLDEPQLMTDWERAVRSLHDKGDLRLYLTGSSAKQLPVHGEATPSAPRVATYSIAVQVDPPADQEERPLSKSPTHIEPCPIVVLVELRTRQRHLT